MTSNTLDQHIERANAFAWNALQAIVTHAVIENPRKTLSFGELEKVMLDIERDAMRQVP
jgi:hypothetical protein